GREIKTDGDGFVATFDGPARAIRCASAIHDEIRPLGIEIRAGLHTGECELMGDDVGGIAVHIGARVAGSQSRRGPRVEHGERPGRGLWDSVCRSGSLCAQRCPGRMATVRCRALSPGLTWGAPDARMSAILRCEWSSARRSTPGR